MGQNFSAPIADFVNALVSEYPFRTKSEFSVIVRNDTNTLFKMVACRASKDFACSKIVSTMFHFNYLFSFCYSLLSTYLLYHTFGIKSIGKMTKLSFLNLCRVHNSIISCRCVGWRHAKEKEKEKRQKLPLPFITN